MYSLNKEVFVHFEETILTADELSSDSLSKSAIVLVMFGCLWGVGVIGLVFCFLQRQYQRSKIREFEKNKIQAAARVRSVDMNRILARYLDEVFPVVFQSRSYVARMVEEILKHHRYINLLTSRKDEEGRKSKVVTCFHLLSAQTMLMFLLALCYELQVWHDPLLDLMCVIVVSL